MKSFILSLAVGGASMGLAACGERERDPDDVNAASAVGKAEGAATTAGTTNPSSPTSDARTIEETTTPTAVIKNAPRVRVGRDGAIIDVDGSDVILPDVDVGINDKCNPDVDVNDSPDINHPLN